MDSPLQDQPARRLVRAPSPLLRAMESTAVFEIGALVASSPVLRLIGRGDRHPVLVLPGFTASDRSTVPLRAALRNLGYWAHGWGLGSNLGPSDRILDGMTQRLADLHERHGRKVSLVGWSLGGIYAREMARENPEAVRQVITLGSPFRMMEGDRSTASTIADRLTPMFSARILPMQGPEGDKAPLEVPSTAIYTRTDGIVRWFVCINELAPYQENIEVRGSHSGLGYNPAVVLAVADRLRQPEGEWHPFVPPVWARSLYPRSTSWHDSRPQRRSSVGARAR